MNTVKKFIASLFSRKLLVAVAAGAGALAQHQVTGAAIIAAVYVAAQAYENANTTQ